MGKPVVGLQLYSVRDRTEIDFLGTLEKVSEIGYKAIEFTDFFQIPERELRSKLSELDLKPVSAHISLNFKNPNKLLSDFDKQLAYSLELGVEQIVTPWSPLSEKPTAADVKYLVEVMTRCGQRVKDAGLKYSYHNHAFEFKLIDQKPFIQYLLEEVPAELMTLQLDLGWVYMAGCNSEDYLEKYKDRIPTVHAMDFAQGRVNTNIGKGEVGYDKLAGVIERANVQYVFIEQEQFANSSLDSAACNYQFFQQFGWK